MIFLSAIKLGLCILVAYIFVRGCLGVMYEAADWAIRVLDGSDNKKDSSPPQ